MQLDRLGAGLGLFDLYYRQLCHVIVLCHDNLTVPTSETAKIPPEVPSNCRYLVRWYRTAADRVVQKSPVFQGFTDVLGKYRKKKWSTASPEYQLQGTVS